MYNFVIRTIFARPDAIPPSCGRYLLNTCQSFPPDAHRVRELDNHRWGVALARRGRGPAGLVANSWPVDRFLGWADGR